MTVVERGLEFLDATSRCIDDFFGEYNYINVPIYQRPYSWQKENIKLFLEDIYNNEEYYIGNIMTALVYEDDVVKTDEIDIIDGQQRLISIFLILCALKNKYELDIDAMIDLSGGEKLIIGKRAPDEEIELLVGLYLTGTVALDRRGANEFKIYNSIIKIIDELGINENDLLVKILKLKIVEVRFNRKESDAHGVFVSLNTKGKALEAFDVIKSQLFKYLLSSGEYGNIYKNNWHSMLNLFDDSAQKKYLKMYFLLNYSEDTFSMNKILESINSRTSAEQIFKSLISENGSKNSLCLSASAVLQKNLELIKNNVESENNYSFEKFNSLFKLYTSRYSQLDIVWTSMLYFPDKARKRAFTNSFKPTVEPFVIFMAMHQMILSMADGNPNTVSPNINELAKAIFNGADIKPEIKKYVKELKIHDIEYMCSVIRNYQILNNRELSSRYARFVTQLCICEGNYYNLKLEHFINQSDINHSNTLKYSIGNCIPVSTDVTRGMTRIQDKLTAYENVQEEPFIDHFLGITINLSEDILEKHNEEVKNDINICEYSNGERISANNYPAVIVQRTEIIAKKYAEKYAALYNELTR